MAEIKKILKDKLQVYVYENNEEMGAGAAKRTGEYIRALLKEKESINMIFAAAPSQNTMLNNLILEEGIDWTRIHAFHMDEYIGLPSDAEQSFGRYLKEHIFDRVPFSSVNLLCGTADPDEECLRYSALLEKNPVDIVCLGIGENAHIAFNDPWVADFDDPKLVKVVPLDPVCRLQQVHDGCFKDLESVPEKALTLTIPALTNAKHMVCCVPHATKRQAVKNTVFGDITVDIPATIMRKHDCAVMFCDRNSGEDLL